MNLNLNEMLVNDSLWLASKAQKSTKYFTGIAEKIDLRQSDWSRVWSKINEKVYEVHIGKKVMKMDAGELQYTRQFYGALDEVSACCGAEIHKGKCDECGSKCKSIFILPR